MFLKEVQLYHVKEFKNVFLGVLYGRYRLVNISSKCYACVSLTLEVILRVLCKWFPFTVVGNHGAVPRFEPLLPVPPIEATCLSAIQADVSMHS